MQSERMRQAWASGIILMRQSRSLHASRKPRVMVVPSWDETSVTSSVLPSHVSASFDSFLMRRRRRCDRSLDEALKIEPGQ